MVVYAHFNRGFGDSGPYGAFLPLSAVFQSGVAYKLKMDSKDAQIELWLEDNDGKKVSSVCKKDYMIEPRESIPIVVTR